MLDAAGHLFGELGFDAATTEQIAERAGVSIGSLYQYFPNKDALFDAIADRYLARARAVFEEHMLAAAVEGGSWEDLIDRAIDAFDYLQRTEVGGRAVWMNWARSTRFFAEGAALNAEFAERAEGVLALFAPGLPAAERRLVATVVVEIISSMLFVSIRAGGDLAPRIVQETKVVVRRYLAPIASASTLPVTQGAGKHGKNGKNGKQGRRA